MLILDMPARLNPELSELGTGGRAFPAPGVITASSGSGFTILLAEDDPKLRKLACLVLKSAGYFVLPAADGRDAFAQFLDHRQEIDLLVTDFEMPNMDGLQLACEVAQLRPETKILLVSGDSANAGLLAAPWPLLFKPFHPDELVQSVAAALESQIAGE